MYKNKKTAGIRNVILILLIIYIVILMGFSAASLLNFSEKQAVLNFKKQYSAYNDALLLTAMQMSDEIGCYYSADKNIPSNFSKCERFYKKFATNLNVRKFCNGNALEKSCVPVYSSYTAEARCAGFSESMINKFNQVFVMEDQSSIIIYNYPTGVMKPMFAMDINGNAKPNKSGFDLFSMVIMRNSNGNYYFYPNITYCLPVEKGGFNYLTDIYKE